jgi:diguanylate cyclase (GGDEF)-like protein
VKERLLTPFHLYVTAVIVGGLATLAYVVADGALSELVGAPALLYVFFGCVIVAELIPINVVLRGQEGELLTSTSFAFAITIAFGWEVAVLALGLGSLIGDLTRRKPFTRALFNVGQYTMSILACGLTLSAISDVPRETLNSFTGADLPLILLAGLVFFIANTAFVATVIALVQQRPIWSYFVSDFLMQSSTAGFALGLAPVLVLTGEFSIAVMPLLALPLIAIHNGTRTAVLNEHQALHDALTGLPNRSLFHDRVEQALESARRHENEAVVMVMDLDHFKEINDTLGHYHGDRLLQLVGERIRSVLRAEDTVARLGGDEFAVLLPSVPDAKYGMDVANKILDGLRSTFEIDGLTLEVGGSIGIACYPEHGEDVQTLVQRADIAMYVAKSDHTGAEIYETQQDQHSVQRLALAGELRRAIENDELVLHYQPKVDVATGRICGVEALARWQHPSLGLIMPDDFIPMAEHTGLITPLTKQVMDLALGQVAAWNEQGRRMSCAVNLCARSFLDTQLLDDIRDVLAKWDVDPSLLELEITESMIVGDPERARGVLDQLAELGITIAIDDFGTGYSSLAYLRHLPVDEIKIDKSFVFEMSGNSSDEMIVRSIIDLAHNLQLRAVAEGVEDQTILNRLGELGCDIAQGYHISRPLPPERFEEWMGNYSAQALWQPERAVAAA